MGVNPLAMTDELMMVAATAFVAVATTMYLWLRVLRQSADTARLAKSRAEKQDTPPSLYPLIDADKCIGSLSCVRACPEGDILGLVAGKATLVEGSHCIGHSRCELDCPVDAITLVFGTKEKGVDLPETDEHYESSRPGVYIIGELGGMGLIKNALRQGLAVVQGLKLTGVGGNSPVDVAIVGAGPAGIATAVACREAGLSYRLLEQETLGGTVAHYPRNKVVMTETVNLPFFGEFGARLIRKESLIEQFEAVVKAAGVHVDEEVRVEGLQGEIDRFTLKTNRGDVHARRVVLATGLRGSPRKLGVPGEDLEKVVYRLVDPAQYDDCRVLVVGGGDSALEAAIQLATESSAKVTLSYRKASLSRAKPRNRELIEELIAKGSIRGLLPSEVRKVTKQAVVLDVGEPGKTSEGVLKNDYIIVAIGGEVPTKFLNKMGVEIRRYRGEAKGASKAAGFEAKDNRRLAWVLTVVGATILGMLMFAGRDYYFLDEHVRESHRLHDDLKPSGFWGHGVGIIATLFMMANFLYVLRKRVKALKGLSHIRTWLTFHMFVGIMSPLVIAFHAAFLWRNALATATWISLGIVVGTGVFGRFLFGLVPSHEGKLDELRQVEATWKARRDELEPLINTTTNATQVLNILDVATAPPKQLGVFGMILHRLRNRSRVSKTVAQVHHLFVNDNDRRRFESEAFALLTLRIQAAFYGTVKRIFRMWLVLHVVMATSMVVLITLHIAVSLYLGYAWVFST
jgi:thioredoxin reductase/Pyruvate/2-oxoacid:ferredoxin oxidoreductase delta subunit